MNWIPSTEEITYYKGLNQDKASNEDYYKSMLPLLLEKVNEDYTQSFDHINLPANVKLFLAKATQFYSGSPGLKSRSMGTVSYSFDFSELPETITGLLVRYRKAKYHVFRRFE